MNSSILQNYFFREDQYAHSIKEQGILEEIQLGYILDNSSILKGSYYYIQLQNQENNAAPVIAYNTEIQGTMKNFEKSGDPVMLEVVRSDDGKMKVSSYCNVFQAFPLDVAFG